MPSNAQRGAYYKARSRKWLAKAGYDVVVNLEEIRLIYRQDVRGEPQLVRAVKQDQLGADLMGVRRHPPDVVVIQVKGGRTARSGLAAARRTFRRVPFPDDARLRREIHVWLPRAREPQIIDCTDEPYEESCEDESPGLSTRSTTASSRRAKQTSDSSTAETA